MSNYNRLFEVIFVFIDSKVFTLKLLQQQILQPVNKKAYYCWSLVYVKNSKLKQFKEIMN